MDRTPPPKSTIGTWIQRVKNPSQRMKLTANLQKYQEGEDMLWFFAQGVKAVLKTQQKSEDLRRRRSPVKPPIDPIPLKDN